MQSQTISEAATAAARLGLTLLFAAALSACANYAGIRGSGRMATAQMLASEKSLPSDDRGHWPAPDWADQFGDSQLKALIEEALAGNPSVAQAQARIAAAAAAGESARAGAMPRIDASYSLTRQQYSSNALVPPPYSGAWATDNHGLLSASYDLDLWGKHRAAIASALSQWQASRADAQVVKLTLTKSIAHDYNELARLYALRDIAEAEVARRTSIDEITERRIAAGLDTQVERKTAQADLATSRAALTAIDADIVSARYRLAALVGAGPDRGLAIARPALRAGDEIRLPQNLPADLVSRRPELVAARWRVEAFSQDVKEAKAEFYPDINLSAAIGLDAFGFGRFLTAGSRIASAGPAIHLPIFDAGALRAQLKGRYAQYDAAVAAYNDALVSALAEVATQLAQIRAIDAQLVDARAAQAAADDAQRLALMQYRSGLTNQLTVLHAQASALAAERRVANLRMDRRDRQIALAAALGGGYADTSPAGTDSGAPTR